MPVAAAVAFGASAAATVPRDTVGVCHWCVLPGLVNLQPAGRRASPSAPALVVVVVAVDAVLVMLRPLADG